MQFTQVVLLTLAAVGAVSARASPARMEEKRTYPQTNGSCSTGTAQCCSTIQSGKEAESTIALLGLNDVFGDIGLDCQQVPINAVGAAVSVQNQCKNTPVCCTGSHANGLIQASCTPLSVN